MSGPAPKVTVLALAYNQAAFLEETLESIRTQSFQDFELLISDDASSDDSAKLIQQWNDKHCRAERLFLHDRNIGLCPTLNELLDHARGEYLQFIACDDHLLPNALAERVDVLERADSDVALVYSDALMMDDEGRETPGTFLTRFLKGRPAPEGDLYSRLLMGNFLPGSTVLSRTERVRQVGGFDASLKFEDWDLWQKLSRSWSFVYTPGPTARYRIHEGNLHKTMSRQASQFYRILSRHRDDQRARLRIMLTIVRNVDQFEPDSEETVDFLSWADEYPDTRLFRKWYFPSGSFSQAVVKQLVTFAENMSRPFTKSSLQERRQRNAA